MLEIFSANSYHLNQLILILLPLLSCLFLLSKNNNINNKLKVLSFPYYLVCFFFPFFRCVHIQALFTSSVTTLYDTSLRGEGDSKKVCLFQIKTKLFSVYCCVFTAWNYMEPAGSLTILYVTISQMLIEMDSLFFYIVRHTCQFVHCFSAKTH